MLGRALEGVRVSRHSFMVCKIECWLLLESVVVVLERMITICRLQTCPHVRWHTAISRRSMLLFTEVMSTNADRSRWMLGIIGWRRVVPSRDEKQPFFTKNFSLFCSFLFLHAAHCCNTLSCALSDVQMTDLRRCSRSGNSALKDLLFLKRQQLTENCLT